MVIDCDTIVVGAGLAGLNWRDTSSAWAGRDGAQILDGIGGRVRTDEVYGFRLDRGFQVLLTAYPKLGIAGLRARYLTVLSGLASFGVVAPFIASQIRARSLGMRFGRSRQSVASWTNSALRGCAGSAHHLGVAAHLAVCLENPGVALA